MKHDAISSAIQEKKNLEIFQLFVVCTASLISSTVPDFRTDHVVTIVKLLALSHLSINSAVV